MDPAALGKTHVDLIGARGVPFMARRAYTIEVRHFLFWGLFAGLVEGTVSAVVVAKTFGGSNFLITVVQATPAFANLVSLYWGALIVGRRKIPAFIALASASVAVALSIAVTPRSDLGGWIFALQICLSRVFMSGVVTTRASLWKSNYPRSHRGRITANLQIVRTLMSLPVILGGGLLFDLAPDAYHWFYPTIAVIGAFGLLVLRGERVRGEERTISHRINGAAREPIAQVSDPLQPAIEAEDEKKPLADDGVIEPFSLVALVSPWQIIHRMKQVLRADPRFARYCKAQMCIGTANLMVMPVNTIVLTKVLNLNYTLSNGLLDFIPRVVTIAMLPVWARLFDRVGVLRFRMSNSLCWCGSLLFCGLGALFAHLSTGQAGALAAVAIGIYVLGRLFEGFAQSGGAIAWNIGHLHFAEDDKAELYMGIHVSLTGLRGLIAPFLGALLYTYMGWLVFMVGFVISLIGYFIFAGLAREEAALSCDSPQRDETAAPEVPSNGDPAPRATRPSRPLQDASRGNAS